MARRKKANHSTYTVTYDASNHFAVLTQMWGSVWPNVFFYCAFNAILMLVLIYLKTHFGFSTMALPAQGNAYLTVVVAFLLVSRVNIGLGRFTDARSNIGIMYQQALELVQNACVFSERATTVESRQWRHELAYRMLVLLRTSMAVIDYPTDKVPAWEVPELQGSELEDIKRTLTGEVSVRWAHIKKSEWETSMRVPLRLAFLLRKTIGSNSLRLPTPLAPLQEVKLNAIVDGFMSGYYGMRKFLTTPIPFPLIQMARSLLFFYVFSIPFQLIGDNNCTAAAKCVVVFVVTFAFMGLELTAMELDNPFGYDANDFNNVAMAMVAYEDAYLSILDLDGEEWVNLLRRKMDDGDRDESNAVSERSWLLDKIV